MLTSVFIIDLKQLINFFLLFSDFMILQGFEQKTL